MEEPDYSSDEGEFDEFDEEEEEVVDEKDEAAKYKAKIDAKNKADSLLYDSKEDEKNSNWVEKNMRKSKGGRKSDAVLLCPCCFTPLCYDCQRHASYKNQFRAMFVVNCEVDTNQILKFGKGEKMRRVKAFDPNQDEVYHPTTCTGCNTEVAVMDKDEVYHFFNVIPSDS
eukprot:Phypoly_transcript_21751.p1 GENE.Phypoly_transcript_21751~~Phypoly_transcript_21751.p1  ORF type:complete len:170 (+),score=27.29 Phypoly_transcript_21751:70-579(+)